MKVTAHPGLIPPKQAGTLILTGTPEGVGMGMIPPAYLSPGDEVTVAIEGLGSLTNVVEFEK